MRPVKNHVREENGNDDQDQPDGAIDLSAVPAFLPADPLHVIQDEGKKRDKKRGKEDVLYKPQMRRAVNKQHVLKKRPPVREQRIAENIEE